MAFKAPSWFGNHVTNQATARWLGRNRPATGGGATSATGSKATAAAYAPVPTSQTQPSAYLSSMSVNPHPILANSVIAEDGNQAPSNSKFAGFGIASVSAFR